MNNFQKKNRPRGNGGGSNDDYLFFAIGFMIVGALNVFQLICLVVYFASQA